ncbi:FGGY family carbohydrate kinase, partial [Spirillospora sp. NPDC049652]
MTRPNARDEAVWIGIDLGTQSVRALAVTAGGRVLGAGGHPLTDHRDGPRHEQDPEEWWTAVGAACRQALRGVPAGTVQAVAVDGTSGTILLADETGRPLTPGLMYDDTRAVNHVERVNRAGGHVWERLGYQRMQPAWALPRLLWLLEHRRDLPGDGVRLAHQTDFVNARLTGHPVATDLSSALKTGADLVAEDWPRDVLDALGVPAGLLPPLERSGTPLGAVSASAAEHTGLPAGIPVVAGCTDGCASQLGAGRLTVGSWNSVLGTTLVLKGVTDELVRDPHGVVYSHRAPDGHWLPGGASSTGAGALTRDFPGRHQPPHDPAAAANEPTETGAYPQVTAGERFPIDA